MPTPDYSVFKLPQQLICEEPPLETSPA